MPAVSATAPGKIILFGEHAVVYGQPAIAVPVTQVRAKATVSADISAPSGQIRLIASDLGLDCFIGDLPAGHALVVLVEAVAEQLHLTRFPALKLQISSNIPIAAGLGSGAAVSVAAARALSAFVGHPLDDDQVSHIAYRVDQVYHGTPSGIDNTVIAYAQPIFYVRGEPFQRLFLSQPITLVIGNSGNPSPTSLVVADLRVRWQADPQPYERKFEAIGEIGRKARLALESGYPRDLGPLMTQNHALLQDLDVSSLALDRLVEAALASGALGAKLCGAGCGGNMIALAGTENAPRIAQALETAGAVNTIITTLR